MLNPEQGSTQDRLQALHAASSGGAGRPMVPAMALALAANFGDFERWRGEFTALAKTPGDDSGWVLLTFVPEEGTLRNEWVASAADAPGRGVPILALETGAALPIDALLDDTDWAAVYERYQHAVHEASEPFGVSADELADALVLDVRRAGMFEKAAAVLPGASWRDPAAVTTWSGDIPGDREVVVYCVYGHEVGRATALRLRAQGVPARYLRGGIDGWQADGRPLEPKEESS